MVEVPGLPRFSGGAVGYLSYDLVRFFEKLPEFNSDDLKLPDVYLIFSDTLVVFDHLKHKIKIISNAYVNGEDLVKSYQRAMAKIDKIIAKLKSPLNLSSQSSFSKKRKVSFSSNLSKSSFVKKVKKAKEYIKAGDIIQVVISQRFQTEIRTEPFNLYRALRSINPSPYMYYLKFKDLKLIGSSPEILVRLEGGRVTVRPIAGTRPRGKDEKEDRFLEKELLSDEKEKVEHIMLVDLGRNDIGKVCRYGSVKVNELMKVERYSHVMHLVSNVNGKVKKDKDQFDVLRSSFPAGTVTGAPKVRAMEIIEELEPIRRGPYAGAVGYFSFSGNLDACITIRTLVIKNNVAYLQAGAGIVADSIPEKEYEETKNKAKALMEAILLAEKGL
ncbi:Anthranilate synthase component 1 [subsurface metagenome]